MPSSISTSQTTIGSMLRQAVYYVVPENQRDYSWTDDEVEQLWIDIIDTKSAQRGEHFLGAIVVNDADADRNEIIDGQQRLATISILISVLRSIGDELGDTERSNELQRLLGDKSLKTLVISPKIQMNEANNKYYNEYIIESKTKKEIETDAKARNIRITNYRLLQAFLQLYGLVKDQLNKESDFSELCGDIIEIIDSRLSVIRIAVKDEESAYWLFETLNDRGLDLSTADLLKNYLLRQSARDRNKVKQYWDGIIAQLGNHSIPQFVRAWWLSTIDVVREKDLYREIIKRYRRGGDVVSLAKNLNGSAEPYSALFDVDHDFWGKFNDKIRRQLCDNVEELAYFNVRQCFPVLLAALETLGPEQTQKVFKAVSIFAVRHSIVSPGRGTGSLENAYSAAALAIRKNPKIKWRIVFRKLESLYPSDEFFDHACTRHEFRRKDMARYVLRRIHDFGKVGVKAIEDSQRLTLEHILPKNPPKSWLNQFDGEDPEEFQSRLGNLTLLEIGKNRGLGNKEFSKKKAVYKTSEIDMTKDLAKAASWNATAIENRSKLMAKKMCAIWRIGD